MLKENLRAASVPHLGNGLSYVLVERQMVTGKAVAHHVLGPVLPHIRLLADPLQAFAHVDDGHLMPALQPHHGVVRDLDLARIAVLGEVGRHFDDLLLPQDRTALEPGDLPPWADTQEEAQRQVGGKLGVVLLAGTKARNSLGALVNLDSKVNPVSILQL